jgi:hypothetical protein
VCRGVAVPVRLPRSWLRGHGWITNRGSMPMVTEAIAAQTLGYIARLYEATEAKHSHEIQKSAE